MSIPWDLIAGVFTAISIELTSRHDWRGWLVGLLNQGCWFALIVDRGLWGLFPLTLFLTLQYWRALRRWRSEEAIA